MPGCPFGVDANARPLLLLIAGISARRPPWRSAARAKRRTEKQVPDDGISAAVFWFSGTSRRSIFGLSARHPRASTEGGSDAHSGFGDFDDRDGFDGGTGSGPDVRSGLSGLPACVRPCHLLRMPLHLAASVQRIGIWPRRPVRHQSIFCERASGRSAASPHLLKLSVSQRAVKDVAQIEEPSERGRAA